MGFTAQTSKILLAIKNEHKIRTFLSSIAITLSTKHTNFVDTQQYFQSQISEMNCPRSKNLSLGDIL